MAHKRNPIACENVCSLARVVRGLVVPTYENVPLWHERDLTNSAAERFTIPHASILVDDMLVKMGRVFSKLEVYPERMMANLESAKGLIMAEAVMMALVRKGVGRQDAHEMMRRISMKAADAGTPLKEQMMADKAVSALFKPEEMDAVLDPKNYIGEAEKIVERTLKEVR
jgi:adenylosuccinate lyase